MTLVVTGCVYNSTGSVLSLGQRAAYVRQRRFEPFQQEQMVLQYVGAHGRITRRDAAELCQLAPLEARSLLKRLVMGRQLMIRGHKRGSFYELPIVVNKSKYNMGAPTKVHK